MATLLVKELSSIIADGNEMLVKKVCIKELIMFLERIKGVLEINCSSGEEFCENEESLLGALGESLRPAQQLVNRHKCKRRLYWIICLGSLNQEVEEIIRGIGNSLEKLPISDDRLQLLTRDMQRVEYEVSEGDAERFNSLLELDPGEMMVTLARDLGINVERDKQLLSRELRYLKADLNTEQSNAQLWKKLVERVDDLMETLACENSAVFTHDENAAIPSFEAFECPLTKQVMKDPVVIQSEHTYERHAIEEWFKTCMRSKREPTCPITGMVLASTELHPNRVLRKAIEEWYQRNVAARVESVREKLKALEDVDDALDEILRLAGENPLNKFTIKEACLIPEIAKIWSLEGAAYFRAKALIVLEKVAEDDVDNQSLIVKEGLLRSAVRSLGSREDEEKANAAKLLLRLTENLEICTKLGTEKGAIIHLVGLTASKAQDVASVAEKTLRNLEKVDSNILEMAEAGRLQPLLNRLREGAHQDGQIQMAKFLAKRHLVKSQKKLVAQTGSASLMAMLSGPDATVEAKEASLEVFLVLASIGENKSLLLGSGLLPTLVRIMFSVQSSVSSAGLRLKELAAGIVSRLVSTPGHWEHTAVDSDGNSMHSEPVIHNLLGLMMHIKPNWKSTLLEILIGLVSSPEVADETCTHIQSGYGIRLFLEFLSEATEGSQRLNALKLLARVSARMGPEIVSELSQSPGEELERIKRLLRSKNKEECSSAACLLGNIPLTSKVLVSRLVDPELISWITQSLAEILSSRHRSQTRVMTDMNEGMLGILLHMIKSNNPVFINDLAHHRLMNVLVNQLERQGQFLIKQRASMGIKHLSERASGSTKLPEPPSKGCFCFSPKALKLCPVHSGICDPHQSVCMIKCEALNPVVELLDEDDEGVQLAAMEALSTLLGDDVSLRGGVEELARVDGVQKIVEMFCGQQRGDLLERSVWMIERIARVEEHAKSLSVDTRLFRALVEAFKSGNPATRALAQEALTNLKQLSGVSAGNRVRRNKH